MQAKYIALPETLPSRLNWQIQMTDSGSTPILARSGSGVQMLGLVDTRTEPELVSQNR